MIYIQNGLYVTIRQIENPVAPPFPLASGFSENAAYLVLGAFSMSESGEAYFIVSNDRDEIWFISNRHLRSYKFEPDARRFRIELPERRDDELAILKQTVV